MCTLCCVSVVMKNTEIYFSTHYCSNKINFHSHSHFHLHYILFFIHVFHCRVGWFPIFSPHILIQLLCVYVLFFRTLFNILMITHHYHFPFTVEILMYSFMEKYNISFYRKFFNGNCHIL